MRSKSIILVLIIFLAAFLRLFLLDKIPNSINGDEMHYLIDAKSFFLSGKDVTQTASLIGLLSFHYPPFDLVQGELQYFLEMPFIGPLPFTLFLTFLPNAILGIGTVILIYLITKKLFDIRVALFSSFFAAINPWYIFIGRTAYEMIPATFFYLCGFYILLLAKKWKILLSLPFFILAFYADIAAKPVLIPLVLAIIIYSYFFIHKKQFALHYGLLFGLLCLFVLFFFVQIKTNPTTSRLSEILLPNSTSVATQVDAIRKTSLANPLSPFFENKLTVFLYLVTDKVLYIFSPDYLFMQGDYFASLGLYGLFYPIDFLFLIIGASWLFYHKRRLFIFFGASIFFATIPQLIHTGPLQNFTPHINLLFPFLLMIIGLGAWQLFSFLQERKKYIVIGITAFLYFFSIGYFLNIYFFRMPLQHNFFNFPDRVLSHYVNLVSQHNHHLIVYTQNPKEKFKDYLFYNNLYNKSRISQVASSLLNEKYTVGSITFLPCNKGLRSVDINDIAVTSAACGMSLPGKSLTLPDLSDNGAVYRIYNDTICEHYQINPYISHFQINDFSVEKLPQEDFCMKFFSK